MYEDLLPHTLPTETERLDQMGRAHDPDSRATIQRLDLPSDSKCLDIGTGRGSMAIWLGQSMPDAEIVAVDLASDLRLQIRTSYEGETDWPFVDSDFETRFNLFYGGRGAFTIVGFTPEETFLRPGEPLRTGFLARYDRSGRAITIFDELPPALELRSSGDHTVVALPINPDNPIAVDGLEFSTTEELGFVALGLRADGELWGTPVYEGPDARDLDISFSPDGRGGFVG
ncbi:MAG: hypothetical protein AAF942_16145, partial [Pseudomonadota bacterium]